MKKLYCIRKYVTAESALDAMQKDHKIPPHEVFIDDGWMRKSVPNLNLLAGLPIEPEEDNPIFGDKH